MVQGHFKSYVFPHGTRWCILAQIHDFHACAFAAQTKYTASLKACDWKQAKSEEREILSRTFLMFGIDETDLYFIVASSVYFKLAILKYETSCAVTFIKYFSKIVPKMKEYADYLLLD